MSSLPSTTSEHDELPPAHSLREAADGGNMLLGDAALNDPNGTSELAHDAVEHPRDEQQEIAHLAYLFYLDRGGEAGSAEEDWFRAEKQIRDSRS